MGPRLRSSARMVAGACLFLAACSSSPSPVATVSLPRRGADLLRPVASFELPAIAESSGLVASRRTPGLLWTHNDSGDGPVLFAVDEQGKSIGAPIRVPGATNVDWEDIAADDAGNLWIADIGNNLNSRTDLCLYVLPEPDPRSSEPVRAARRIPVRYPDQQLFPPPNLEYDAEALVVSGGRPYILTKHRGSTTTKLYRLDRESDGLSAPLTLLGAFDIGGMVTAADVSADGRDLLVLTYGAVWLFSARSADAWFEGSIRWLPIAAAQCEGICFASGGSILLCNEQRQIFRLRVDDLLVVRE